MFTAVITRYNQYITLNHTTVCPVHKEENNIASKARHSIATCDTDWKFCEVLRHFLRQDVFCSLHLRGAVFKEISKCCKIILSFLNL
jgi:hypothetical protein